MAKTSTSFTSETAPKGASKHRKTKVKERLGLNNWQNLTHFVLNEGLDKMLLEMEKLRGRDYLTAYTTLLEYVKPKLSRTTVEGDKNAPIEIFINGSKTN